MEVLQFFGEGCPIFFLQNLFLGSQNKSEYGGKKLWRGGAGGGRRGVGRGLWGGRNNKRQELIMRPQGH